METFTIQESVGTATACRSYAGGYFNLLISPEQTNGSLAMIDITLPKGSEPPPHIHNNEDETFYLLEGDAEFTVGGEKVVAKPGEAIFGPRGVPHHFKILSPQARVITIITPGDFANFFLEFSQPVIGEPKVVVPQGPPPPEAIHYMITRLATRYNASFI